MGSRPVPFIRFTEPEVAEGGPSLETLRRASQLLREEGCIGFENAFRPAFIEQLRDAYLERYERYTRDERHVDALKIGDKRFQITVEVETPFDSPLVFANPLVFPIIQEVLGQHCIVGVFGSVMSLPGAEAQHVHRDHPLLYEETVNAVMPAFAVTMMIPLVDLDERTGTTRMWVGSHGVADAAAYEMTWDDPMVKAGGCLLFDLRLLHGGLANRADIARPMLYNAYYRPWFTDSRNYAVQQALVMKRERFERMPRANKRLFVRAETPEGARLTTADPYQQMRG